MSDPSFRRDYITKPIFRWARHVLPSLSDTEREAIEAGDVWWDADLFTGNPDWAKLLAFPAAKLTPEEQAFLDGSGRRALPHARRLAHQLGARRPAARGVGLPQGAQVLRDDHSEEVRRAGILRLRAFGGDPQALDPLDLRGRHRHGAELARPRRAAAAVRHQGAAGLLAAAPRRRRRKFPASGSPVRRPARTPPRWSIPAWSAAAPGKAARCSASGSTGTSATSRSVRSRPCWASPSSSPIPIT